MWESLKRFPRGRLSTRNFVLFFTTLIVACFVYILAAPTPVNAVDANWVDDGLTYDGRTYTEYEPGPNVRGLGIDNGAQLYRAVDGGSTNQQARFIFFQGGQVPMSGGEATYVLYTLNPPNDYSNARDRTTVTIEETSALDGAEDEEGFSECTIEGVGWFVCPVMKVIAEGMDTIFGMLTNFLVVQPVSTSVNNPIYRTWVYARDLANVSFIIAFMFIIYSHITSVGLSNYGLKRLLPRLIVAAVLVNLSYIICSLLVDLSNIAGYSINSMFENVRDTVLPGSENTEVNWVNVTAWILGGATAGTVGGLALTATVAGAAGGLWFLLAPLLLGAALIVIVTFVILAIRQALIVILIVVAPLAFVAYLLPNTEKWFEKWRSIFFTMLIMFPAFAAVFGGAQLAGQLIIRTATSIEQVILGLGVQVAPLAIVPLLLKLGGGILNRFAGIVNNPSKGLLDRYKNYNKERLGEHQARNNADNAQLRASGGFKPRQVLRRRAAYDYAKKNYRGKQKELDEERAQNYWHDQHDRWGLENNEDRGSQRNMIGRRKDGYGNLDTYKRTNALTHARADAHHDEHWQELLRSDTNLRSIQSDTRITQGRVKLSEAAMEAEDDRTLQTMVDTNPAYANLRAMKVQTSVDAGIADIHKQAVESAGKVALGAAVSSDRNLRVAKVQTFADDKRAETMEAILKKNAEANWNNLSKNDDDVQELRLREVQATDQAKITDERFNKVIAETRLKGGSATGVAAQNRQYARSIQTLASDTVQVEKTTAALTSMLGSATEQRFVESAEGKQLNVQAQAATDSLEAAKLQEAAIVEEWRTERGAEGLTGQDARVAAALQESSVKKMVETQRSGAAKRTKDVEYAKAVQVDSTGLAVRAGGIEDAAGVSQAKAVAFQTIVQAQNKGTEAEKTLLSRTKEDVLLDEVDANGNVFLGSPNILDEPTERISAMGGTIAGRRHQVSHIKLWKRIGELKEMADREFAAATTQDEKDIALAKIDKVKDLQQQVMADKASLPFGVGSQDQGSAKVGEYDRNIYEITRQRIDSHMSAERLSKMDPDDIRLLFEMARAGKLNQAELDSIAAAYKEWSEDENLKVSLEKKQRVLLDPILAHAQGDTNQYTDTRVVFDDLDSKLSNH